eukprot:gene24657-29792_t
MADDESVSSTESIQRRPIKAGLSSAKVPKSDGRDEIPRRPVPDAGDSGHGGAAVARPVVTKQRRNISDERRAELRERMAGVRAQREQKNNEKRDELERLVAEKEAEYKREMDRKAMKMAKKRILAPRPALSRLPASSGPVTAPPPPPPPQKKKPTRRVVVEESESDNDVEVSDQSSDEEEIIIRRRTKKPAPAPARRNRVVPQQPQQETYRPSIHFV